MALYVVDRKVKMRLLNIVINQSAKITYEYIIFGFFQVKKLLLGTQLKILAFRVILC